MLKIANKYNRINHNVHSYLIIRNLQENCFEVVLIVLGTEVDIVLCSAVVSSVVVVVVVSEVVVVE